MVASNQELNELDQQLENSQQRLKELWQDTDQLSLSQKQLLVEALADFCALIENLKVASLALSQQKEELAAIKLTVEAERQRYQELFEFIPNGCLVTDSEAVILEANETAASLLNSPQGYLVGKPLTEFIVLEDCPDFRNQLEQLQSGEQPPDWEIQIQPRQGKPFLTTITAVPVQNYRGQVVGLRWQLQDITQRQRYEMGLQRVDDQLTRQVEERTAQLSQSNAHLEHGIAKHLRTELALRQPTEWEWLMGAMPARIRQSLNLKDILNTTVTEVRRFLTCDRVVIYRVESSGEGGVLTESVDADWPSMLGTRIDTSIKQRMALYQQGHCSVIHDIQQAEFNEFLRQLQVKASLTVPIVHENQFWGLIAAHQCSGARYWQTLEIDVLCSLATQVSTAIEQSELYQEICRVSADLGRQVQEQSSQQQQALNFEAMLKRITDHVRDNLDESQILQTVVQELTQVLGIYGCDTSLYDSNQLAATIRYEYTPSLPSVRGRTLNMKDFAEVYAQLVSGDYFQFCELVPSLRRASAMLACPIFDDKGVLGDLWLFKGQEDTFNELEIQLVQQVASQCAIAIRQARLYQAAQGQVEQLEKLARLKDDFLSTVSHELRTPIANMKMAIQMLGITLNRNQPLFAELSKPLEKQSKVARYFQILHSECERENRLINDLLDLQRIDSAQTSVLTLIQMQDWLPTQVAPFQERTRHRQQNLQIDIKPELAPFVSDAAAVGRIVAELLENACKYTPLGEQITVTAHSTEERMELRVINSGVEIPASERERIFEKFYRIPSTDPFKQSGTGLGLALVQKLVVHLGGTIQVESASNQTCFKVSLPLNSPS